MAEVGGSSGVSGVDGHLLTSWRQLDTADLAHRGRADLAIPF
jgi:hypothetical protein